MPEEGGDLVPLIVLSSGTIAGADGGLERHFIFRFYDEHSLCVCTAFVEGYYVHIIIYSVL